VVSDTPAARGKLFHEGLSLQGDTPHPGSRVSIPTDHGPPSPLGIPPGKARVMQALGKAALEPAWEARWAAHASGCRPGRGTMAALAALHSTLRQHGSSPWLVDAASSGCFDNLAHGP